MNAQQYAEAKKLFDTYDARVAEPGLTVEEAWSETLTGQLVSKRNELLQQSDWTQLPDSPADKEAWATYRQALRDLPEQTGFPIQVTFPTSPVE